MCYVCADWFTIDIIFYELQHNAQYIEHEFVVGVYDISDCPPCKDAQPKTLQYAMYYMLHRSSTWAATLLVFSKHGDALPDAMTTQMTM